MLRRIFPSVSQPDATDADETDTGDTTMTNRPTHTVTPTAAELIAAALGHDGTTWATPDGVTLDDLIDLHGGRIDHHPRFPSVELYRAVFADYSALTVGVGGWDIGYANCWCWQGNGHDNCTAGEG